MAGLLIYIPGRHGQNPEMLRDVGLGALLTSDDSGPSFAAVINNGPDGGAGALAFWDALSQDRVPRPTINKESQVWQAAKPCGDLQAGRFWLGYEKSRPPTPECLSRRHQHPGEAVTLNDGNEWLIPVARQLPRVLGLDESGNVGSRVDDSYREFFEQAYAIFDLFDLTGDGNATLPHKDGYEFASLALSINYRVNRDVCDFLGLIGTKSLFDIPKVVCELEKLLPVLEKKSAELGLQPMHAGAPG